MSQTSHNFSSSSADRIHYFGYGSLVNRDTRPTNETAVNATLKGFRRVWNHRVRESQARAGSTSLSVEPAHGSIDGVVVCLPASELAGLDARERGYERVLVDADSFQLPDGYDTGPVYIYRSLESNRFLADAVHPIAQSYIDCVMAGYLERFGKAGLHRFALTTRAWASVVRDDRQQPTYPRSVPVSPERCAAFDSLLEPLRLL